MSFLSDASYWGTLEERIRCLEDATAREYVTNRFQQWRRQYRDYRLIERAVEMLAETQRPNVLHLHDEEDVRLLRGLAQRHRFDARVFRGFLVSDSLWGSVQPQWFTPFPAYRLSDWQDREDTSVLSLSRSDPPRTNRGAVGNDYLERFIDLSRMSEPVDIRTRFADKRIVLYADYRKVQTLAAIAEEIRKSADLATVLLVNKAESCGGEFDAVIEQPAYYLWPLIFKTLAPDLYHVNVGWGTQGLPFAPFLPKEAIIDFYDLLTFVRDDALDGHHSEPLTLTRASERTLLSGFSRIIHRCSDDISTRLSEAYPGRDIVSVTEYLREPVYGPEPARKDQTIRLVYGGLLVQDGNNPDDPHYKSLLRMAQYYCQGNLHLYLYPSPYLYGFGEPKGLEELTQRLGLSNVHPCMPLSENDFVREIVGYDFGMCIPTPEEVRPTSYGYILPGKIIAYLRAGLPIVVPEDQTFVADLVREHGIGVVYKYEDRERMAELLNSQDIAQLKQNVVRFREQFHIDKAAKKVLALYDGVLKPQVKQITDSIRPSEAPSVVHPSTTGTGGRWAELIEKLCRSGFIGEREYQELLEQEVRTVFSGKALQHVSGKLQAWFTAYRDWRCLSRLLELIAQLKGSPYCLYLDDPACVSPLAHLLQGLREIGLRGPGGFVVAPGLESLKAQLASCPMYSVGEAVPDEFTVLGFSGASFPASSRKVVLNDYLERFIDSRRLDCVREILRRHDGRQIVLYPLYREIHTVSIMAKFIRQQEDGIRSVCLSPSPLIDAGFDAALVEPSFYLWPLIFRMIDPDLVHLNVGWGIQALPFSAFLPDRKRAVIDFYEVLSFLPDAYFEKTHSSAEQVRFAEAHFFENYDHIMHMCSEQTSTKLAQKYGSRGPIVSVTEYLQEPTYSVPPKGDGDIRLVYGGCMLATTDPDDLYCRAFVKVAPYFARENLHLYIYNSPYVHGMGENSGLKEVIQKLGLTNAHACTPLKLDDFVKEISEYDYGVTLLRPKDMNAVEYNYFMAYKFLTYLRAGLPILVDADNHFMASLVNRYNIGIVLHDYDLESLPEILSHADLPLLKRNVVKFRNEFGIDKGGAKVIALYREILSRSDCRAVSAAVAVEKADQNPVVPPLTPVAQAPAFEEMIRRIAAAENRLYYRDQSAGTMSSLAGYARQLNPSVVVELGTLAGLSLRAWIDAAPQAEIYAVDLSFKTLRETLQILPADLSRVTLLERDILKTDLAALWKPQDRVILFVDAHDLPDVTIMEHVLRTAVPLLPDGSMVIVDDLWFSEERLTQDNARSFLAGRVLGEIDELQCFHGYYAPYHKGGSFMGFAEVIPLLRFVNRHGIELVHEKGGKHVGFLWKKAYLSGHAAAGAGDLAKSDGLCGSVPYNPMESVPVAAPLGQMMREVADLYLGRDLRAAAGRLSEARKQYPHDKGLSYGLAVCLARGGMLVQARDVLAGRVNETSHPQCRRLFDDLVHRVGPCRTHTAAASQPRTDNHGLTIFAMPKAFTGHTAVIQKNAIRSWARLQPTPEIILFGNESGIRRMAEEVGAKHITDIQRNEFGTPLVDRLFQAAQEHASHRILAYVNADMILLRDFTDAVQQVQSRLHEFLVIGQRWDLTILDEIDFDNPHWRRLLQEEMVKHSMLHAECGLDYFIFSKGLWPTIPPFAIGRTAWDNWLVMAPNRRGVPVVDGTECITAVHQDHDYGHVTGGRQEAWNGAEAIRNRALAGEIDDSALTTGAPWVLRKDGALANIPVRQPQYMTQAYRDERTTWLLAQADRLQTLGRPQLAACKCEESLGVIESLLALRRPAGMQAGACDRGQVIERYTAACILLARCYTTRDRHERAAAVYARLLENPRVPLLKRRREGIVRARDEALAAARAQAAGPASIADRQPFAVSVPGTTPSRTGPKFTVVTTCHNSVAFLPECLESIRNQTLTDWELLLIDDGSTDDTRRIMEQYGRMDPRIQLFFFDGNEGPYVRRRWAIAQARSDLIAIHDSDDLMAPDKLKRLYDEITSDSRLAVVASFYRIFIHQFKGLPLTELVTLPMDPEEIVEGCVTWRHGFSHGSAVIRKEMFARIGDYDANPFGSDSFWSAKLGEFIRQGAPWRIRVIPEPLTLMRIHAANQTQQVSMFDPRSRRTRYHQYCERKLQEVRERTRNAPGADIGRELRDCDCSDFLVRFQALIPQWEGEPLDEHVLPVLLDNGTRFFEHGRYVSCVRLLTGVEVMQRDIARCMVNFDLLTALALYALDLKELSRERLHQEIRHHDNPAARQFMCDCSEEAAQIDVCQWMEEHAGDFDLGIREAGPVRNVSSVCRKMRPTVVEVPAIER